VYASLLLPTPLFMPSSYPSSLPSTLQVNFSFGGGSGNGIHNSTTISSSNIFNTGSGLLCGIAATFQDADESDDPLITQVAFFFLQPIESVSVSGINTTMLQPVDNEGYSLFGQINVTQMCQPGLPNVCTNTVNVKQGNTATTTMEKSVTHGQSFTDTEDYSFTVGASAGIPDEDSVSFSSTLSLGWSQEYSSSTTNSQTTSTQQGQTSSLAMTLDCNCPVDIPPNSYW
jgi:hypothetical protein